MADRLSSDARMNVGESITSNNGQYTLILQPDGNLVLYKAGGEALWATGTSGKSASFATQQKDGNFVLYASSGALWASGTSGYEGTTLVVQDDGNLVVYGEKGPLWAVYGAGAHLASTKPAFPIKGSRHDDVAGGHMQTDFTLDAGGMLSAVTRWWTNVKLTGFTGSVTVVLTDEGGRALWATNPQTHGVDGEWVGDDDRYENWSASVPSAIIDQIRGYAILQQHEPHWRIFDKGEQFLTWLGSDEGKQTVGSIVSIVEIAA